MTEERTALIELAEKHADDDLLRELGQLVLQRLMDAEAEQRCGASRHERSEERVNQRNGYRERTLETRLGTLDLPIPKLRTGSYLPSFLEPCKASEQALVAVVQENWAEARHQWRETTDKLRERFPRVADLMDDAEDDVLAFMQFPQDHWPQLASTNPLERLNKEIKRRSQVAGIFPNNAAIYRLVGTLLAGQTDPWQVTRRYMNQESLARVVHQGETGKELLAQSDAA